MARVITCFDFPRSTQAAFVFYKAVFGGDFTSLIMRFRDVSVGPGRPELAEGGKVGMRVWGGYFGAFADCSGMHWAFNCASRT